MINQIEQQTATHDLTVAAVVFSHTPDPDHDRLVQLGIALGDADNGLTGEGGAFELTVERGGQVIQPGPQTIAFGTATRAALDGEPFVVPAGAQVIARVKSPNGGDTAVPVVATLYDVAPVQYDRNFRSQRVGDATKFDDVIFKAIPDE